MRLYERWSSAEDVHVPQLGLERRRGGGWVTVYPQRAEALEISEENPGEVVNVTLTELQRRRIGGGVGAD